MSVVLVLVDCSGFLWLDRETTVLFQDTRPQPATEHVARIMRSDKLKTHLTGN